MALPEGYEISTDRQLLDIPYVHAQLTESYWATGIPLETVEKSIQGALCFGIYQGKQQVGFARIITDRATFAYLADVFVDEKHRGKGLSKALMQFILARPELQGLRRILLGTRDAHGLYAQFGFEPLPNNGRFMHLHNPEVYKKE